MYVTCIYNFYLRYSVISWVSVNQLQIASENSSPAFRLRSIEVSMTVYLNMLLRGIKGS